jgi:sigma-B regulation protein RsbU (phosphoserine phosphatase)
MNIINNLMRVTPPIQDGFTGEIVLTISQPIAGNNFTTFEGTISYDIPIDFLIDFIKEIKFSETGFAFLTQSNGNIFSVNDCGLEILGLSGNEASTVDSGEGFNKLERFFSNSIYEEVQKIELNGSLLPQMQTFSIEGKEYFLISRKLKGYQSWNRETGFFQEHWNLGFMIPKDEVFKILDKTENEINMKINEISYSSLLVSMITIFLLLGTMYLLIHRVTKDLHQLVCAANEIKSKNYNVAISTKSSDEVGLLSNTFNSMIKEVKSSFTKLSNEGEERKKSEQKYISLMEAVPDPVNVYDKK